MANIRVLGAGIAGLWQAFTLLRRGHSVTLNDPAGLSSENAASRLAGAMLAPYCEGEAGHEPVRDLGIESLRLWQDHYPGTSMAGTLVLALPRDLAELRRFATVTGGHSFADGAKIAALEPSLAGRFSQGLFYPGEGHVVPRDALVFLAAESLACGLRVEVDGSVSSPPRTRTQLANSFGVEGTRTGYAEPWNSASAGKTEIDFAKAAGWGEGRDRSLAGKSGGVAGAADWLVDCRGIAAKDSLRTLRGVRGERIVIECAGVTLNRPIRLLHPRIPFYIVPWPGGRFMIGATVIESEDGGAPTLRSAFDLLSAAYALDPAFGEARIVDISAGVRPAFPGNAPQIAVRGRRIFVNGLYRHGFLLSPILADATADYIERGTIREGVVVEDHGER